MMMDQNQPTNKWTRIETLVEDGQEIINYVEERYLTDDTPFTAKQRGDYREGFLYYGDGQLTDHSCIKNVYLYTKGQFTKVGKHKICVYGPIEPGQYITTCSMLGCGVMIDNRDFAFAQAITGRKNGKVGLIDAVFL